MKPTWTGEVISKMHIYSISQTELAKKMGCSREYVNSVLNGKYYFANCRSDIETAIANIIAERKEE